MARLIRTDPIIVDDTLLLPVSPDAAGRSESHSTLIAGQAQNGRVQDGTELQALIAEYGRLRRLEGCTPQSRGQRFNEVIAAMLRCWGIDARSSVRAKGEVDVAFAVGGIRYVVEAKWENRPADSGHIAKLQKRVRQRLAGTYGVFVSMAGYTAEALADIADGDRLEVLLLDAEHLEAMLSGLAPPEELLTLLHDRAAFFGDAHTPLLTLIGAAGDPPTVAFGTPSTLPGFVNWASEGDAGEILFTLPNSNQLGIAAGGHGRLLVTTQRGIIDVDLQTRAVRWAVPVVDCHRNPVVQADGAVLFTRRNGVGRYSEGRLTIIGGGLFGSTCLAPHPDGSMWAFANGDMSGQPGASVTRLGGALGDEVRHDLAYPVVSAFTSAWVNHTDLLTIGPEFLITTVGNGEVRRHPAAQSNPMGLASLGDGTVVTAGDSVTLGRTDLGSGAYTVLARLALRPSVNELCLGSDGTVCIASYYGDGNGMPIAVGRMSLASLTGAPTQPQPAAGASPPKTEAAPAALAQTNDEAAYPPEPPTRQEPRGQLAPTGIPAWLEQPPASVPAPIPVTAPAVLPFEHLTPDDFERLILALARQTFTVEHAQQYGVRGQKQHGIDLYCRLASPDQTDRRYVTIQCRNVIEVTPTTLTAAVDAFLEGIWADRTGTFVFATRASTLRTELAEAVEAAAQRLRDRHIRFEIWDGERLSERLRYKPDLVELFFGTATAEIYCIVASRSAGLAGRTAAGPPTRFTGHGGLPTRPTGHAARSANQPPPSPSSGPASRPDHEVTPVPGRWQLANPGPQTLGLSNGLKEIISPYHGSHHVVDAEAPPSVRIGISIASEPLPATAPPTSQIRRRFLDLLNRPPIAEMVAALTPAMATEIWRNYGDVGRSHYAAILASPNPDGAPSAWTRLLLPTPDQPAYGRDPRCAGFVLHADWTTPAEGQPRPPVDLRRWRAIMNLALSLPAALAAYLADELAMTVGDDPVPAIGVWLATPSDLTELIDIDGLAQVGGSRLSRWYDAYAVADDQGRTPSAVAEGWITQLCDEALHLDGYEEAI